MLEKYCDILIVGTELPGLVAGAFLARRGLNVQVIDCDLFSDHTEKPDPVCLTHLHSKLLRSILGRLNVPESTIQNFVQKESSLQVILPKNRVDVFNNPLLYFEEVEREFGPSYKAIKDFYELQAKKRHDYPMTELFEKLFPHGWNEKRRFKKFLEGEHFDEKSQSYDNLTRLSNRLKIYLKSQLLLCYQKCIDQPFGFQVAETFNPGDGEIFGVGCGLQGLKKILTERITHYDGVNRKKAHIHSLLYRNGVFEGVELDDSQGSVLSKYVLWNSAPNHLAPYLPNKWRFKKFKSRCERKAQSQSWFSAKYSLEREYIPNLMKSNVLYIADESAELTGTNFLYLQINRAKVDQQATVWVNFLLPETALEYKENDFDEVLEDIQNTLHKLLPFSKDSLVREFPQKPQAQDNTTLFPLNDNDYEVFKASAHKNPVSLQTENRFVDLIDLSYETPAPNLYLCHPEVFRGFGLDAKLQLGMKVTDQIWQEVEKVKKRAIKSERRIA